jgi:hypothetical protein
MTEEIRSKRIAFASSWQHSREKFKAASTPA